MLKITIEEDAWNKDKMADLLEEIAALIRNDYTSGDCPTWALTGKDEGDYSDVFDY